MAFIQKEQSFNSIQEELLYWKNLSKRIIEERDGVQREYEDYMTDSQQLEKEYEITIDQHERSTKELKSLNNVLQNKLENIQMKLEKSNRENQILRTDIEVLKDEKEQFSKHIRELEQKNDDLERAHRVVAETVGAFELSLNSALERNAMLESEIDEKESLKEKLQRLADETRDLKQELLVRDKEKCPDNERIMNGHSGPLGVDSNRLKIDTEVHSPLKRDTNISLKSLDKNTINVPLSPASRVIANNILGDLIRKVGSLETKLGRCRNCGYNNYKPENIGCNRTRHSSRGPSSSIQVTK